MLMHSWFGLNTCITIYCVSFIRGLYFSVNDHLIVSTLRIRHIRSLMTSQPSAISSIMVIFSVSISSEHNLSDALYKYKYIRTLSCQIQTMSCLTLLYLKTIIQVNNSSYTFVVCDMFK